MPSIITREEAAREVSSMRKKYKGAHPELLSQLSVMTILRTFATSKSYLEFALKSQQNMMPDGLPTKVRALRLFSVCLWKAPMSALRHYERPFRSEVSDHGLNLLDARGLPIIVGGSPDAVEMIVREEESR